MKKAKGPIMYPSAFSVFWDNIGSPKNKGLKSEALKAWEKAGRPPGDKLIGKWNEYLYSLGETWPKHVASWINASGWLETYGPPARGNGVPEKFRQGRDAMATWLERQEGKP